MKHSETGETALTKRTLLCHVIPGQRVHRRLPEMAETCVVRLINQRRPA